MTQLHQVSYFVLGTEPANNSDPKFVGLGYLSCQHTWCNRHDVTLESGVNGSYM